MPYQFGGQQYIRILYLELTNYIRAVCITCGLHKSEHVSSHRQTIGWLSASSLIQHRTLCAMLDQYTSRGILLNPHIQYGCHHTPDTSILL